MCPSFGAFVYRLGREVLNLERGVQLPYALPHFLHFVLPIFVPVRRFMIVTTGNEIEGKHIVEYLGVVRGIVVRATGIGRGFIGGLKSIAGGNIEEFSVVCEEARMEAFNRMVRHAHEIQANAVIGMRYDATEFSQGATEVLAYGTAVRIS